MTTLLVFSGLFAFAQSAVPAAPNCDQILGTTKAAMQKEADANCKSVTRCVTCTDKKLGQLLYTTMVVNPTSKCASSGSKASMDTNVAERGPAGTTAKATVDRPTAPSFELVQERCEDGTGINIDVFMPGNAMQCTKDQYAFLWEIDGGKGGHAANLQCACGKVAQLTVTEIKTGLSQMRRIELLPCSKSKE